MLSPKAISRTLFSTVILAAVVFTLGCKSSKKVEDSEAPAGSEAMNEAPRIDSTPMGFDAQGSDSGKIDGLETVNFEYDRAVISAESKKRLQGNANWMKAQPKANIQIEGHCDSRGSIEYNLALGERRAQAVKNYLVGLGISAKRLSIISYGKERPLAAGDSEADNAKNRRANFVPLGN